MSDRNQIQCIQFSLGTHRRQSTSQRSKVKEKKPVKMCFRNFIGDPMVRTSPSNAGESGGGRQGQIQSVVGDLRDHMPHNQKIKKHETEAIL